MYYGWILLAFSIFLTGCASDTNASFDQGLDEAENGRYSEATELFSRAVRLDSTNARAYLERAKMAGRVSVDVDVESDLAKYIELTAPDLAIAYVGRGLTRWLDRQGALDDFERAMSINPDNLQGFYYKKKVLAEIGDSVGLRDFFDRLDENTRMKLVDYVPKCLGCE